MERRSDSFWKAFSIVLLIVMVALVGVIVWQSQNPHTVIQQSNNKAKSQLAALSPGLDISPENRYWISDLADKAMPYVVNVETKIKVPGHQQPQMDDQGVKDFMHQFQQIVPFGMPDGQMDEQQQQMDAPPQEETGVGSGFVARADGYIVTNAHVVNGGSEFNVHFADGKELPAKLIGKDGFKDIAVLKVAASDLPVAPLGSSKDTRIGEPVIAIGSPIGFQTTVTAGIISANDRSAKELGPIGSGESGQQWDPIRSPQHYLQTDAAINRGNSGGPLINADGEVIGVNQLIARSDQVSPWQTIAIEGIGFAIPIDEVKDTITQIIEHGSVSYPGISASIMSVEDYLRQHDGLKLDVKDGVYVNAIVLKGPADKAGIKAGDVILSIDGKKIKTAEELITEITTHRVGDRVVLRVARQGGKQQEDVSVVLEKLDLDQQPQQQR